MPITTTTEENVGSPGHTIQPEGEPPVEDAATGSAKITQRQLEGILINEGIIQAAAIEDPDGYDGGRTELAMTIATQQINALISANKKGQR